MTLRPLRADYRIPSQRESAPPGSSSLSVREAAHPLRGYCSPAGLSPIRLSIGEPQHATPGFIRQALVDNLGGLASYPTTQGSDALRQSIAGWLERRYGLPGINAATQVLPVNGSREALFAFAQCVIDGSRPDALVVCPNPFYQIYEGAAYLAGATPYFVNTLPDDRFASDCSAIPEGD